MEIIKIEKRSTGLTLIELLVAIGIVGIVGGIATIILFTTLQNAGKSDIMREVKQNGNFALTIIERMVRNATAIVSDCPQTESSLTIENPDGQTTTFSLVGTQIASTGGMLTNNKVAVNTLSFTCSRASGRPDVINISFTLSQAGSTTRPEEQAQMTFQTTVSLRTY